MTSLQTEQLPELWAEIQRLYPALTPSPALLPLIEAVDAFYRSYHYPLLIVETDEKGIVSYVNQAFAKPSGYTTEELLGQNINVLRSDANPPGYFTDLWNTIKANRPWRGIIRNRTKDYELYQIDLLILPLPESVTSGQKRYLGVGYDVTHRMPEQQRLENLEKDYIDGLTYARRIQRAIFPTNNKDLQKYFPESFLLTHGRDIVSGDFCWIIRTPIANRTILAVADCTGHGIPGGLLTIIGYNLLSQIILYKGLTIPAKILSELHKGLREYFLQDEAEERYVKDGMEIILCSFDYALEELQFAGANRPLWLIREGELIEYKTDKESIGGEKLTEDIEFTHYEITLQPEDRIYLFTDGITDQFGGPQGKRFGTPRLRQLLLEIWKEPSMARQRALFNNVWKREWMGDNPATDDATLVGLRITE